MTNAQKEKITAKVRAYQHDIISLLDIIQNETQKAMDSNICVSVRCYDAMNACERAQRNLKAYCKRHNLDYDLIGLFNNPF